jgi:hypothetical protein
MHGRNRHAEHGRYFIALEPLQLEKRKDRPLLEGQAIERCFKQGSPLVKFDYRWSG